MLDGFLRWCGYRSVADQLAELKEQLTSLDITKLEMEGVELRLHFRESLLTTLNLTKINSVHLFVGYIPNAYVLELDDLFAKVSQLLQQVKIPVTLKAKFTNVHSEIGCSFDFDSGFGCGVMLLSKDHPEQDYTSSIQFKLFENNEARIKWAKKNHIVKKEKPVEDNSAAAVEKKALEQQQYKDKFEAWKAAWPTESKLLVISKSKEDRSHNAYSLNHYAVIARLLNNCKKDILAPGHSLHTTSSGFSLCALDLTSEEIPTFIPEYSSPDVREYCCVPEFVLPTVFELFSTFDNLYSELSEYVLPMELEIALNDIPIDQMVNQLIKINATLQFMSQQKEEFKEKQRQAYELIRIAKHQPGYYESFNPYYSSKQLEIIDSIFNAEPASEKMVFCGGDYRPFVPRYIFASSGNLTEDHLLTVVPERGYCASPINFYVDKKELFKHIKGLNVYHHPQSGD